MQKRIYGIETEYGIIFTPEGRKTLPVEKAIRFLFEKLITTEHFLNVFLENGARFYQDTGCHPEYATPECASPRQLIVYDKAGERILEDLQIYAEEKIREERIAGKLSIFKNNTDFVGNSYGCHENYLVDRDVDFYYLAEQLIPFLVTRQIYTGAGKVFQTQDGVHYCISQRAQHIYQKISGTTTNDRSIINTRDEPHADREKYRRLHVIVGDSNMSEYTNFLKIGAVRGRAPDDRGQLHQQGLHAAQPGQGDQGHLLRHHLQAQAAPRQRPRVLADRDPARVLRDGAEVHRAVPGLRRAARRGRRSGSTCSTASTTTRTGSTARSTG